MVTTPDSCKKPTVVKVKRKSLLQGQSKVRFPSNPRFNVRVHCGVKEPKPASEHSLVKIRRRTPPHGTLKLTPPLHRRKQALTMEKKESGRQTSSVKTRKKKNRAPGLKSKEEEAAKTVDVIFFLSSFCRLVFCFTPKYTITSDRAWETTPNHQRVSHLSPSTLMWRNSSLASLCLYLQKGK